MATSITSPDSPAPVVSQGRSSAIEDYLRAWIWVGGIIAAAFLFFGLGIIMTGVSLFALLLLFCEKADKAIEKLSSFFAKVAITGVAWQFMGIALISGPNVGTAKRFFEDAEVDFNLVALVDSMNYRTSMHEVDIATSDFETLISFYQTAAEEDVDESYGHPHQFAELALSSTDVLSTVNQTAGDWLHADEVHDDLKAIVKDFPAMAQLKGNCRILIWRSHYGDDRFFVWFEDQQKGFLKCDAGFG